ncbi:glycosylase [Spirochaetia bacterium]|nr:glycosylase [Spirochaetia bacterium]
MFRWKKRGVVFNPCDYQQTTWLHEFTQAPNTLVYDDFVRVYISTRLSKDEHGRLKSLLAYVDLDRKDLFKIKKISPEPLLKLGDLGHFDEFGTYILSPLRISDVEIWAYYVGITCQASVSINAAIGMAKSFDNGDTFEKVGCGPVLGHSLYEPFLVSSHKIRKYNDLFYMFYISGTTWAVKDNIKEPIYKIRMAISKDGLKWEKQNRFIIENKLGDLEAQACPDVFYKNDRYHMFFSYRDAFDYRKNPNHSYRIGYAYSTDLLNWIRDDTKAGIDISKDGFDNEMVAYPHVFELDCKIYMLYVGNEVGRYGFGLTELEGVLE